MKWTKKQEKNLKGYFHKRIDLGKKIRSEENSQFKTQWVYRLSLINPIYKQEFSPVPWAEGAVCII